MALPPYEIVRQNRMMQAAQPVMTSGVPEDPLVRAQQMMAAARAAAPQGIDPRMAALLDRQLQRVNEQEQIATRGGMNPVSEMLIRAGAAMMANRGPVFGRGLAAGITEGLGTMQERRMNEMRARAAAAQQRDQIEMDRLRAESAGVRAAEEGLDRTVSLAGKLVDVDASMAQAQENLAKAARIDDPQLRALELAKARADVRAAEALALQRRTAAEKNMREPAGGGGTGDIEARQNRTELDKAAADYEAARALFNRDKQNPEAEAAMVQSQARLVLLSRAYSRLYGNTPYPVGGMAVRPVAPARPAAANNDPLGLRR